ncbi:RNA polymerase sigma factor [Novosphingobium sp. 9]|uniref:RNA polymerase sigma factor n=1 Tax=Novosphingobium sp. 9 TaxID=2025349 RepID=UPI0021B54959|nr:sigma-70 region 4 domain-containing protein [Novosphingobium sp. 9]
MRAAIILHHRVREWGQRWRFRRITNPQLRRMLCAVHALPAREQQVFRLACYEDLSNEQVAARMGLSTEEVVQHLSLALRLVADSYERQQQGRW